MRPRSPGMLIVVAGCLGTSSTPPHYPYQQAAQGSDPSRSAQALVYDEPGYVTIDANPAGDAVGSLDVFYAELEPYGIWYDDPTYGWVFTPPQSGYVPYSNGHWKYTDYGLLWVSSDPFGWATDHYGRWVYQNRWLWTPDLTWGPAWVSWRQADGWIGWAPVGYTVEAYVPDDHWRFVVPSDLFAVDLGRRHATTDIAGRLDASVPIMRFLRHAKDVWVAGPSDSWMRGHKLDVKRDKVEAVELGRLDAHRRSEVEQRARERQREWDQRHARENAIRRDLDQRLGAQRDEQRRIVEDQRRFAAEHRRQADDRKRIDDLQREYKDARMRATNDAQRRQIRNDLRVLDEKRKGLEDAQRRVLQQQIARRHEEQLRRDQTRKRQRADQDRVKTLQEERLDAARKQAEQKPPDGRRL